jgi:Rrf2 family transcriptional regulator, iron-sulfur cluster assembly transcription factor
MLGFSRKLVHAIEAVIDIAYNAADEPVQSSEVTRRQGIPKRHLEPVLQQLVRDGVLAGVRGPRGGYRLAKERKLITVGDIARVVATLEGEGDQDGVPGSGSEIGRKVVQPLCRSLRAETFERLDAITVEELCRRARGEGVPSEAARRLDYSI